MIAKSKVKSLDDTKQNERNKAILLIICKYLNENGYLQSSDKLQQESGISLQKYEVADNIDLQSIFIEYEDYYFVKFEKKPKLFKAKEATTSASTTTTTVKKKTSTTTVPSSTTATTTTNNTTSPNLIITNSSSSASSSTTSTSTKQQQQSSPPTIPDYYFSNPEYKELLDFITQHILIKPNTSSTKPIQFDDIIGLEEAKQILKETITLPLEFPHLFDNQEEHPLIQSWKGILLFGPSGTGKTLLAKAVCNEMKQQVTFFNVTASAIISKWRGDSEKLIQLVFLLANVYAPSIVFFDEVDSIATKRNQLEHEASRRLKTELLVQLDGLVSHEKVFVIACSNTPWDLDMALLRRLEKRILIDLPSQEHRKQLLTKLLDKYSLHINYEQLAMDTKGFSNADLVLLCRECVMMQVRSKHIPIQIQTQTVQQALEIIKPSNSSQWQELYIQFAKQYGSSLVL